MVTAGSWHVQGVGVIRSSEEVFVARRGALRTHGKNYRVSWSETGESMAG